MLQPDVLGPNVPAHVCPKCAGVLIEPQMGQGFFTSLGLTVSDPRAIVTDAVEALRRSAPVTCTACNSADMKARAFKGIELDVCPGCGSSWLDRGELSRITNGKLGKEIQPAAQPVPGETSNVVGVFEMFWDCKYCHAKELLGKTHRFCPNCGAEQDADARYFPPAGKEVPASAEYAGADKTCPACATPNGAKSKNCRNCGSSLDGAQDVALVADRSEAQPALKAKSGKKGSVWRIVKWSLVGLLTAFVGLIVVAMLWKKDVNITVLSHAWAREVDIETFRAESDSEWCSSMPSGAYNVSRHREQRSTRQVPNGEECSTRNVDRGDGTFERRKDCHTKYKDEAVYDDKCSFTINRWAVTRTAKAEGVGTLPAPTWPAVVIARPGDHLGCERQGQRRETYTLKLRGADSKNYQCQIPDARWSRVPDGLAKPIRVGVLTGIPDCSEL